MTCGTCHVVKSGFCLLPIRGSYTSRASGERCPNFVTTSHTFSQFSRKVWTVLLDAKLRSARIVSLPRPKQDSFFCLPCVSIGAAPSQAAPFEFRSQEDSCWQGRAPGHSPYDGAYQGCGPVTTPAYCTASALLGWHIQTCIHTGLLELIIIMDANIYSVKTQKHMVTRNCKWWDLKLFIHHIHQVHIHSTHTHTHSSYHADTTSVCAIPQQASDHRRCHVSWARLKQICQKVGAYVGVKREGSDKMGNAEGKEKEEHQDRNKKGNKYDRKTETKTR